MIYREARTVLKQKKDPGLYEYLDHHMHLSNNLYNATLFRIRQNFTFRKKEHPTENELEVQREIEETLELCPHLKRPKSVLSYKFLERMMRVMDNPDFFAGLPSQTAEECQKAAVHDFRSWLASLRKYKKHPEKYLGKPKMPHYKKRHSISTITFSKVFHFPKFLPQRGPTTPVLPKQYRFGLFRVRSPLLAESLLFSPPMGT